MVHRDMILSVPRTAVYPTIFGFEVGRPAHKYGPAVRDYWLIHYVTKGHGFFTIGGKNHEIAPGMLFIIPPYTEIVYFGDENDPWDYIWVGFRLDGDVPAFLHNAVCSCPAAGRIFEKMKGCNGAVFPLSACILELFSIFEEDTPKEKDYVSQAVACMEAEYAQELSVSQLARRLGLDRSYFSDLFKKRMGMAPGQYLIRLRMEKAAELMTLRGYTPTLAAQSCGYPDFPQFSKRFKSHFGVSPRQYAGEHRIFSDFSDCHSPAAVV